MKKQSVLQQNKMNKQASCQTSVSQTGKILGTRDAAADEWHW